MNGIRNLIMRLAEVPNSRLALVGLGLTALFWFNMNSSVDEVDVKLQNVQREMNTEKAKNDESVKALKEVEVIRKSLAALGVRFETASKQLPSQIQNSEIIRFVSELSKSAGISVRKNQPQKPNRKDILEEIPLEVIGRGTFSEITNFFYYVASKEKISKVPRFTIVSQNQVAFGSQYGDADRRNEKVGTIQFRAEVVSYRFVGDEKPTSSEVKK